VILRQFLGIVGAMAVQKGPKWWASTHRRHHRESDTPQDVHSPRRRGFWWSHVGWILATTHTDTDKSTVKVTTLEASLTPTSLPDVAAAIINNDFVADAGLTFDDAIAQDDPSDPNALPYVNIFAARAEDKDNETFKKLVSIYQDTKTVTDAVQENSGGTAVFVKTPVADLQSSLEKAQADIKAKG
jgi:hypothetical protein